jgi:23S rRNA (pseudouridine1915-N3)-methyltransferase
MDASAMYLKRLTRWNVQVVECQEAQWASLKRKPQEWWVSLCETGNMMSSPQLANTLDQWMQRGQCVAFFIGSWDGLTPNIRSQCQASMALSAMTWPHLLARVMLLEQLYRAQQRLMNHPYSTA